MGSGVAWAVDCPQTSYTLTTRAVFPPGCDSGLGALTVSNSADITNLNGLANLTSVGVDLYVNDNISLTTF